LGAALAFGGYPQLVAVSLHAWRSWVKMV
jgi:hypothetical protein